MTTKIEIYLNKTLPLQYTEPAVESGEKAVLDVDELIMLYSNKYGSFGDLTFHIYDEEDIIPFIIAINSLFEAQGEDTKVDARLLKAHINNLVPMIVVDNEIISKGTYPELGQLRGGSNSVSRGGTGHTH